MHHLKNELQIIIKIQNYFDLFNLFGGLEYKISILKNANILRKLIQNLLLK